MAKDLQEAKPMWVHNSDKTTTKGFHPELSSPGRFLFCTHESRYPSDTRYHNQNQKKIQKKIVKNMMLLGACIMCKVKPKGAGFTGMKALQGRAKRGPNLIKACP
jgi:hypothetical protein